MKRLALVFTALLIAAAATPAFAVDDRSSSNIVDEVIRMWKASVAEEDIVTYVQKADARFTVSADDVIALTDAKVPRTVIKAVLDEADARGDRSRPVERRARVYAAPYYSSYYGFGPSYYGPAYYDPWYDPFWYRPRFSIGIGVGFGHFRHFRRRW